MQFSAPIYALKRKAKLLARANRVPLNAALDSVAADEGFQSWSHLAAASKKHAPAQNILSRLEPGDLVLIAARPEQGKSLLGFELAATAHRCHRKGYIFTLDETETKISDRLLNMGFDPRASSNAPVIDTSDDISVDYIVRRIEADKEPALVVVDYLQLLDQKRTNPPLNDQIAALKRYVVDAGVICAVISQIDRSYDLSGKSIPCISDIRLPNPLDLSAFTKCIFMHDGKVQFDDAA